MLLLTQGIRFVSQVNFSKKANLASSGEFAILFNLVIFYVFLLGFEFYNFYNREVVNKPSKLKLSKIIQHCSWFIILYIIFIPLFILNLRLIGLSHIIIPAAVAILVFEHLNQEVYRLLIICGKPLVANSLFFIRYSTMGIVFLDTNSNLSGFINYWLCGNMLAFLMAFCIASKKSSKIKISIKETKDLLYLCFFKRKKWKPSFNTAKQYFASSLSFRASTILDKLLLNQFFGKELVAVYTLASTLSSCVLLFSEAFYVQRKAYVWISNFKDFDVKNISYILNQSQKQIFILAGFVSFVSLFSCCFLNVYFNIPIFQNFITYTFLILASFFATISLVDYYFLFAKKQDLKIFRFNMVASIIGLLLMLVLTPFYGSVACALSFLVMSSLNFYLRKQETRKWIPRNLGLFQ